MTMPQPDAPVQREVPPEIIFVRQQFSAFGGAELILDRIVDALGERGYKVGLLARSWKNDREEAGFIRCDPPKVARPLRETIFARAACRMLQKYPHSLVQAHERIPCCDIFRAGDGIHAAYLEQRRRGESAAGRMSLTLSIFHRNTLKLERAMFASERLKVVIVNSDMVADDLVCHYNFPRERIHLVPNGIDLQRFSLGARERHRAKVRQQLGIPASAPVALFVGSGFARKGLARAIRAVASQTGAPHLVVVGSDRRPAAFKALAARAGLAERFHLIGPVKDPVPYYGAADVLILPTIYDPFPSTALEALACGLPVVTTTGCGAREVVRELDPALVCDAYDVEALANALQCALKFSGNPSARDAVRKIAERYDIDTMVERLLGIFNELIPASAKDACV